MEPPSPLTPPPATPAPAVPWEAFDRIYCITLASRPDRRQSAAAEFRHAGLERVEFVTVDRNPTNSEQGIYESHLLCLRRGLDSGAKNMLIFEDDVLFLNPAPHTLRDMATFLMTCKEWDAFFLGCFVNSSRRTPNPSILKIRYKCSAHAYAVPRAFAQTLVKHAWNGVAYDDFIRDVPGLRAFTLYPAIASQSDSPSDNDKTKSIDRTRRLLGGLRRLQRFNEVIHRHTITIIWLHVVVILLLVSLWLWHRFG